MLALPPGRPFCVCDGRLAMGDVPSICHTKAGVKCKTTSDKNVTTNYRKRNLILGMLQMFDFCKAGMINSRGFLPFALSDNIEICN